MKKYCVARYICFLLAFCLIFVFTAPAGFSAGKFTIEPFIELQTRHDSNFYQHETATKSVNTYVINPGLGLKYSTGKSMFGLDYDAKLKWLDYEAKLKQEDRDREDDHNLGLSFQTPVTDLLHLSVNNSLLKTSDPASADDNANSIDRYRYYVNTFSPQVKYQLSELFDLKLKYTNKLTDYIDDGTDEGEGSKENRFGLTLFYKSNSKTTFDMDYQYWQVKYDKDTINYTSNQIMSNVEYRFNQFVFTAGAGYHLRKFDKTLTSLASDDLDRLSWKMGFSGQTGESEEGGNPKSSINMSLKQNYNDAGTSDVYFTNTSLNAQFSYLFTNRLNGKLSGYIKNADYETSTREDDRWAITPALDYSLNDNFTLGLEIGYEERDSNIPAKRFDNKYGMIRIRYDYDAWSR